MSRPSRWTPSCSVSRYNTMPHHSHGAAVMRCDSCVTGGRIVIMDGKLPPGLGGRLLLPFSLWLMKLTMLGNPLIKPWEELAAAVDGFAMEEFVLGSWYVCWGTKSRRRPRLPCRWCRRWSPPTAWRRGARRLIAAAA